jgi:hypothetical protein
MATRSFIVLGIVATTASCSVLIDVDDKQCELAQDCAARGFLNAECRENLCVPIDDAMGGAGGDAGQSDEGGAGAMTSNPLMCEAKTATPDTTVKFTFAPLFASPPENPKPFIVKACQQFDLDCKNPLFGPIDVEAGVPMDFEVPVGAAGTGFIGYFDITNEATLHGLYFMGRAITVDTMGWAVRMPDAETVQNLGFFAQQDVDPNLGIVLSVTRDCEQLPLQGGTFSSSAGGDVFYIVNDLPNVNTTVTGPQGAAGFVNVPLGTTVLNVMLESGQTLKPVTVRLPGPNTISFVEVFP